MPIADVLIYRDGGDDAPFSETLPQGAAIQPVAVNAVFDGSGAGGDYIPALVLLNPSGVVIARAADPANVVTAGDDAEVSWFPGVKNGAAAGVAVGSWLHVVAGTSVPSGTIALQNGTAMPIADFNTNDPARFAQTTASAFTVTRGVYVIVGQYRNTTNTAVVCNGDFSVGVNSSSGFVLYGFGGNGARVLVDGFAGLTKGDQSSLTPWQLLACGADTHAWVGEADFYYVPGT